MDRTSQHETETRDETRLRANQDLRTSGSSDRHWSTVVTGAAMMAVGAWLIYQGSRGESAAPMAQMRGGSQGGKRMKGGGARQRPGVQVRESITIDAARSDLYRFWRRLENLPRVMSHLEEVQQLGGGRSRWTAKGPAGRKVSWTAEITDERENQSIAWRSLEDSEVPNEGAVGFRDAATGGTEIVVSLTYHPPGGAAGAMVAGMFGNNAGQEIRKDLQRFKEEVEARRLAL